MAHRLEKLNSLMIEMAGSFIKTKINSGALITATRTEMSEDLREVKIFISVFPEKEEEEIIKTLKKKTHNFVEHVKKNIRTKFLPRISFEIDRGAKMERRIEEILNTAA